ncbi:MAG: p-hydroxybenzoate 3-monooxygenase [Candidatus Eremiobacteraeota bacterium]|nr:p-hydroxybenzoate 3-monooxygenase [Candidatus Eremiobacteraeota bacterium]
MIPRDLTTPAPNGGLSGGTGTRFGCLAAAAWRWNDSAAPQRNTRRMAEPRGTRTQVGIIGAGPAGLVLALLLRRRGIDSIVLETRSREYCEQRIRAGVLEHGTVELLDAAGAGARMRREGLVHRGIYLRFGGRSRHIDFAELTGKTITVYGQHEVVKDLIAAHVASGSTLQFDVGDVTLDGVESDRPTIRYRDASGAPNAISCDVVAGCDGFHGIARDAIPRGVLTAYERVYPFAWLGILSESPPVAHELIYTHHARGFALFSQRSPAIQRMYLQCAPDEDLATWPDERIWEELHRRLDGDDAPNLVEGAILQKGVTAMRSFVIEPMQYGRLFLAGDAAHIVPPTGAKGMNLAIADVTVLAAALAAFYAGEGTAALDAYSARCLRRVWRAQRFSAWMTSLLHRAPAADAFGERLQLAELDYVTSSHAAAQSLAENYVGLPLEEVTAGGA